jgi:biopolymer transport protein ExbD
MLPAGWTVESGVGRFIVAAKQTTAARVEVNLPAVSEKADKKTEAQEVTVRAETSGQAVGEVKLRVELRKRALPQ